MTLVKNIAASAAFLTTIGVTALADGIPEKKQTKAGLYITAAEAQSMLADDSVLFVDVRSRAEVAFLGLPSEADVNIPYMMMPMMADFDEEKQGYALEINPDFPTVFKAYADEYGFSVSSPIIVLCRSGSRSAKAANLLYDMGYANIYSIVDGYEGDKAKDGPTKGQRTVNGWRNGGFAWSYKIRPEQAYPEDRS